VNDGGDDDTNCFKTEVSEAHGYDDSRIWSVKTPSVNVNHSIKRTATRQSIY